MGGSGWVGWERVVPWRGGSVVQSALSSSMTTTGDVATCKCLKNVPQGEEAHQAEEGGETRKSAASHIAPTGKRRRVREREREREKERERKAERKKKRERKRERETNAMGTGGQYVCFQNKQNDLLAPARP